MIFTLTWWSFNYPVAILFVIIVDITILRMGIYILYCCFCHKVTSTNWKSIYKYLLKIELYNMILKKCKLEYMKNKKNLYDVARKILSFERMHRIWIPSTFDHQKPLSDGGVYFHKTFLKFDLQWCVHRTWLHDHMHILDGAPFRIL